MKDSLRMIIDTELEEEGHDICIMADRHTRTDKSYTMFKGPHATVRMLALSLIFWIAYLCEDIKLDVDCYFFQVHLRVTADLLTQATVTPEWSGSKMMFKGANLYKSASSKAYLKKLGTACARRTIGMTRSNEHSSRSHLICNVSINRHLDDGKKDTKNEIVVVPSRPLPSHLHTSHSFPASGSPSLHKYSFRAIASIDLLCAFFECFAPGFTLTEWTKPTVSSCVAVGQYASTIPRLEFTRRCDC